MRTAIRGHDPRSFDHLPATFDRFLTLVGAPLVDYLTDRLPSRASRAVDLGCGTGQHAALFARHFDEVLAVDISGPMLSFARQHRPAENVSYQRRNLTEVTNGTDGQFDLIFSAHALHHVDDLTAALKQIRALARPGGQVVLVDNVDARHQATRRWLRAEARNALLVDLRRHRRPVREAVELYRLSTHPAWLAHVSTDEFLSPEEYAQTYGAVFPGADFTPMYRTMAMHWRTAS
jgi:2-polyprenyl-3-methyl-5-hydroxy-6-metoxy-1,4-benzoquinol methylase